MSRNHPQRLMHIVRMGDSQSHRLWRRTHTFITTDKKLHAQLLDMRRAAEQHGLDALASNQVGLEQSAVVLRREDGSWQTFVNPRVDRISEGAEEDWERCPSIPYLRCRVRRHEHVLVSFEDSKLKDHEEELRFGCVVV